MDYSERPRDEVRLEEGDTVRMIARYGGRNTFGRVDVILALDDVLVVSDGQIEPHLVVLDRGSDEFVHRFGPEGSGPGEFRHVPSLFPVSEDRLIVAVYDVPNGRLTRVRLSGADFEPQLVEAVPFRAEKLVTGVVPMADRYVGTGGFGADHRLAVFDSTGSVLKRVKTVDPGVVSEKVRKSRLDLSLLQNQIGKEPGGSRVALVFTELNRLEIVDFADGTYRVVKGPRPAEPALTTEGRRPLSVDWDEHERAYLGLATTEDRIYAAFCGCSHSRAAARQGKAPFPRRVQVYDWSGRLVGEFTVDREIRKIEVPPGDSVLYASYRDPVPRIGKWRIPDWVRSSPP